MMNKALLATMVKASHFLLRGLTRADAGAALAELVIIAPMLLLLLIGLIEAGRAGDKAIRVGNAARAGVQFGAQNIATAGDFQGIQNSANADAQDSAVTSIASNSCQCADGTASTCLQGDCATSHRIVFVQVISTGTWSSLMNYNGLPASLKSFTITSTAIMRVAQ